MRLPRRKLGRNAAKGNRQIVKALQVPVGKHRSIEEQANGCSCVQAAGKAEAMFQAELQSIREDQLVFLAAIAQRLKRSLSAQHRLPVDPLHELLDLIRSET